MARRIKSTKRKYYGDRSFGGGNTKNRRGKGNKGGKGRAGYHKHKWLHTIKYEGTKSPYKGFFNHNSKRVPAVSLFTIGKQIEHGKIKAEAGIYKIELPRKKVISKGKFPFKAEITAFSFSQGAIERINEAGGKAIALKKEDAEAPKAAKSKA